MSPEITTFLRALVGLALVGCAAAIALYAVLGRNAAVPELVLPFLPVVIGVCTLVGGLVIRSAFRDATRPR